MSENTLLSLAPGPGSGWDTALERAAELLRRGGVVSFATDTFYALGADPLNASAVERVFRIKQRGRRSPLPVLVHGLDQAEFLLGGGLPRAVIPLVEACWPGPLTLVLQARRPLPEGVTGPDGTVGIRWPRWPVAEMLLQRFGGPITGSSANRSRDDGPASGRDVVASLGHDVDLVLDSGRSPGGPGSTVVRLVRQGGSWRLQIIREGRIPQDRLAGQTDLPVLGPSPVSREEKR